MSIKLKNSRIILVILTIVLIIVVLILPLTLLEKLSLEVVGEPPINGKSWIEGVKALGGDISMRFLAIFGLVIMALTINLVLRLKSGIFIKITTKNAEIALFLSPPSCFS